ncbi:MAG: prepilin-type N-terminal cleavage/methylation domain-containing protein [Candidatus Saccharibacteria bacterium]|nr:MAG: prepilin-type N-terminal cleavage/methylation domain-containing protein [Candidatus Saccharibacteria bacterium]
MRKTTSGFTIVELLIVVVIIAILAAITIVAYNGIQQRAKVSALVSGLKASDKALRLYATDQGFNTWPRDNAIISGYTNPTLQTFIAQTTTFKNYMQTAPNVANSPTLSWFYDNDDDIKPACGSRYNGTNIIIIGLDQSTAEAVDATLDDGDIACGKVRYTTVDSYLFYTLSYSSVME